MPKWRDLWREISAESEKARHVMIRDPKAGKEKFAELVQKHGEDGMILFNRAKAYEELGDVQMAYADYMQAEELFPMEERRNAAREAAAKLELKLPSQLADKRLKSELERLGVADELRKLAERVFLDAGSDPAASIKTARTAVMRVVKALGYSDLDAAESALKNTPAWGVSGVEMRSIQRIRNAVEYDGAAMTVHDARACAFMLLAVLRTTSQIVNKR